MYVVNVYSSSWHRFCLGCIISGPQAILLNGHYAVQDVTHHPHGDKHEDSKPDKNAASKMLKKSGVKLCAEPEIEVI